MAIQGVTEDQYTQFLKNGGKLIFQIDAGDIDPTGGFARSPIIAPNLSTGFELVPSPIIEDPNHRGQLLFFGGSWERVIAYTYLHGGKIIYKKLPDGRFEAAVSMPVK
jgi:hypothetical protein